MSFNNNNNIAGNPNASGNNGSAGAMSQGTLLQQRQLLRLSENFKRLVNEARNVGENTQRGKELLIQASKIKEIYDNYNRQRRQAAQAYEQACNGGTGGSAPQSAGSGTPHNSGGSTSFGQSSGNSQWANLIAQALTPEQNQQYKTLVQTFEARTNKIRDEHNVLKQRIEKLNQEISKRADTASKRQLEESKAQLLGKLKSLNMEFNVLSKEFTAGKSKFYVECASHNPTLQKLLQRSTRQQQQRMAQQQQMQMQQHQQQQHRSSEQVQMSKTNPEMNNKQEQEQKQQEQSQQRRPTNITMQKLPQQSQSRSQSSSNPVNKSQVTNVNATASMANINTSNKSAIFKQSDPLVPISENVTARAPSPVAYKSNRPTLTGGAATGAASLNTPAITKLPPYEVDTERVMSKRKLRELVKTVGIDDGDGETVIDGDVEELLLDLADDFVTNVTGFACRLAKHRKSDNLDTRDIQLHLERNWNIRIPGYSADEIRSTRKWNPTQSYNQKIQSINTDKINTARNSTTVGGSSNKSLSHPK